MIVQRISQYNHILNKVHCRLADKIYKNFIFDKYKVGCKESVNFNSVSVLENKVTILKEHETFKNLQRLRKSDIDSFWEEDKILESCDVKFLERYKHG